jgi:hypothetical protein
MIPRSRKKDDTEPHAEATAGPAGIVRRAFGHARDPQHELERLLEERRAELEEYAARFEETALELGQREERLRDERASVERLIRRSTVELEAREKELMEYERELESREERVATGEADLARRRSELGAVELMRAAVERREQALEAREAAIASREVESGNEPGAGGETIEQGVELLFVPGAEYRIVEAEATGLLPGSPVEVAGVDYVVTKIARSPLPGDRRRCAYLVRGLPRELGGGSR